MAVMHRRSDPDFQLFGRINRHACQPKAGSAPGYEIDVDGVAQSCYFDRMLGNVNGDGKVDNIDVNLVTQFLGSSVPGRAADVDGSDTVTSLDRARKVRARGHALAVGLNVDA
jgi:hypothetical protein